jgi:hypothetical protein
MKPFYTIIQLAPNTATNDAVGIGMLLFDGFKFRHYFSHNKLKPAKKLLQNKEVNIKFLLAQIEEKFECINNDHKEFKLFFNFEKLSDISYFEYLNKYSNGILRFGKPIALYETLDDVAFSKLVQFLFGETITQQAVAFKEIFEQSQAVIYDKLISVVEDKVHTHFHFNPEVFPTIYFTYEMDCIGMNGSLVGAKSVSFNRSIQTIDKDISHYFALLSSLSSRYNKSLKENDFFLITEEPSEIGSKEHQLWETIKLNDLIQVIHPEESDIVADLVLEKNAEKFLDKS